MKSYKVYFKHRGSRVGGRGDTMTVIAINGEDARKIAKKELRQRHLRMTIIKVRLIK